MASISVIHRGEKEIENQDREYQHGQRGPVARTANFPSPSESPDRPVQSVKARKKKNEQNACRENHSVADVVENVMAHLVPKNKKNFGLGQLRDRRVPHDYTFRGTDSGYIRVQRV